jgi:RNA polymerase sigma factor for flagellar operon FliA
MDADERKLWKRLESAKRKETIERLRNVLVEMHLPLCKKITDRFASQVPRSVEYGDIYSAAYQGLLIGVPRYRLDRGVKPETFLTFRIRGEIRDYLRKCDDVTRSNRQRINRVTEWEQNELGRPATDDEIDAHFGFSVYQPPLVSLDAVCSKTAQGVKEKRLGDMVADPRTVGSASDLASLLRGLNKRERIVALQYFVAGDTMKQAAAHVGLSESRVSQMMPAIIERIKRNAA